VSAEIIDQFGDAEFSADILQHRDGVHKLVIVVLVETPFDIRLALRLEADERIDVRSARNALGYGRK
jgi:hypothetical protein